MGAGEAFHGLSEVNLGYMPGGMAAYVIADLMPYRDAVYDAATGVRLEGSAVAGTRFVNHAVPCAAPGFGAERD